VVHRAAGPDQSVAHPFASLLITLRSIRYRFELPRGAAELATKVAKARRAPCWERVLRSVGPDVPPEYADAVPGWLAELFEPGLP